MRPVVGYQRWDDLLFAHWAIDPERLRVHLPAPLEVDTFEGRGYVSLTPFTVKGARLRALPPLPSLRTFHETNLRTYVRGPDGTPGVWFFSLEAASAPAVVLARALRLPYFVARMARGKVDGAQNYVSTRKGGAAHLEASWVDGQEMHLAAPGTLEHFLVERYALFTLPVFGRPMLGRVRHPSWPLRAVERFSLRQTLSEAAGLGPLGTPDLVQSTPGVDVEFFPFERVG